MSIGVFGVLITNLQSKEWHASNPAFKRMSTTTMSGFISLGFWLIHPYHPPEYQQTMYIT